VAEAWNPVLYKIIVFLTRILEEGERRFKRQNKTHIHSTLHVLIIAYNYLKFTGK